MHLNAMKILDASYLLSVRKGLTVLEVICNFHFKKILLKLKTLESEACNKPVYDENNV